MSEKTKKPLKRRIFDIIQIGNKDDLISRFFDWFIVIVIILNILTVFLETFDELESFTTLFRVIEIVTVFIFCIEYILRIWTADYLYPKKRGLSAKLRFLWSFDGIVDLLTILPFFFLEGFIVFRMLRVVRIFHLFRVNAHYDSFHVITTVLIEKKNQIISSVFIIIVLMLASSLGIYSVEHEAQPEAFSNAFSGIWWSVFTLLTVGYGDIYPVTLAGRIFGIIITFLGVGMVAIPTGILSAGFVEQYTRVKSLSAYSEDNDIRFVRLEIPESHPWSGKQVSSLPLPPGLILAIIQRKSQVIVPHGDSQILPGDNLILGAESFRDDANLNLKELTIRADHPWNGRFIKDLDIPRQSLIVMVRRDGKTLIPTGSLKLLDGDTILLYTKLRLALSEANTIEV